MPLCVGGFTNKSEVSPDDSYHTWSGFADAGALSPYSRVSTDWVHGRTPIKPEIVFEAGNRALSPEGNELLSGVSSLSLLTTAKDFLEEPLTTFWATSAATAQAAGMAGRLMAHDPSWWPETIRALMVHSSSWTPWMRREIVEEWRQLYAGPFGDDLIFNMPALWMSCKEQMNDWKEHLIANTKAGLSSRRSESKEQAILAANTKPYHAEVGTPLRGEKQAVPTASHAKPKRHLIFPGAEAIRSGDGPPKPWDDSQWID